MKSRFYLGVVFFLLVGSMLFGVAFASDGDEEDSVLQGAKITSTNDAPSEKSLKTSQQQYDEDEFVGFEQVQLQNAKKETKIEAPIETEIPLPPPRTNYYLEIVYISVIVVYVVNYWIGKRKNEQIATAWASAVSKAFKSNFSKVGEGKNIGIVKESQSLYKLKATGRVNCIGVQATLDLRKRHDLFSLIVELFSKNEDTVTLDILMNDEAMDTFVFAVVKKKEEKKFRKAVPDVPLFAPGSSSPPSGFPNSFVVCSECEELTSDFLNSETQVILSKYEDLFKRLHFSDQAVLSPSYKKTLQFVFRLPEKESDMEGIHILTRMAFYYIDLVAKTTLSKQAKQKTTNNRAKALEQISKQTHEQRQEAAQQRKLAKLQKEKAALEKLSPEEQRKAEEKIQKREMKKRMPKFKVSFG